jgi:outer membrane protein TolC
MRIAPATAAAVLLALSPTVARSQSTARASLDQGEVVRRALANSATARAARARVQSAGDQAKSLRGHLLPSVDLSDEAQAWNAPFSIPFNGSQSVLAREQTTNAFTAAAAQPLLGLLHLGEDVAALGSAAGAAEADLRATEAAVKEAVLTQLLQLFEAKALGEIAHASVAQLQEQLQVSQARLKAGVITRADVLRIETAAANARQQEIEATAQEEGDRASLLVAIGERPDAVGVTFAEPSLPEPSPAPELSAALSTAQAKRPEMESARLGEEAARRRAKARAFDLLPEVNAEAAYLHVSGQVFQPVDSSFIGLKADWPIWSWGAKWYARSAAAADADAAAAQQSGVRDQVAVDVASRLATTRASASAVEVARTAIASAEEAYRVTDALVKAGSATTTDLLDAQAALTTARSNLARARYNYALTRVNLARATGEL